MNKISTNGKGENATPVAHFLSLDEKQSLKLRGLIRGLSVSSQQHFRNPAFISSVTSSEHVLDRLPKGWVSSPVNVMMRLNPCPINRSKQERTRKGKGEREEQDIQKKEHPQQDELRSIVGTDMQH